MLRRLLSRIVPFLLIALAFAAFAFGIIMFAYILLFIAVLGCILYAVNAIKNTFFDKNKIQSKSKKKSNRIIDADDWKEL